jgi:hypothetical protein
MSRTALLIRCSVQEAERIRIEARNEGRGISAYILNIMFTNVEAEDRLLASPPNYHTTDSVLSRRAPIAPGPRTALLVRCSVAEATKLREAARRGEFSINAFVLQGIKRVWVVQNGRSVQRTDISSGVQEV